MKQSSIFLVGESGLFPVKTMDDDKIEAFYRALVPRLLTEVNRAGGLSRLVGFRAMLDGERLWQFLGVEVRCLDGIPD